jgi:hypothetical protein
VEHISATRAVIIVPGLHTTASHDIGQAVMKWATAAGFKVSWLLIDSLVEVSRPQVQQLARIYAANHFSVAFFFSRNTNHHDVSVGSERQVLSNTRFDDAIHLQLRSGYSPVCRGRGCESRSQCFCLRDVGRAPHPRRFEGSTDPYPSELQQQPSVLRRLILRRARIRRPTRGRVVLYKRCANRHQERPRVQYSGERQGRCGRLVLGGTTD